MKGLQGGHSGDDINKGRGNAIKILNRFLWDLNHKYGIRIADFSGGNLRNAIAREASAVIVFSEKCKEQVRVDFNVYQAEMESVWKLTEPGLKMELESTDLPEPGVGPDLYCPVVECFVCLSARGFQHELPYARNGGDFHESGVSEDAG